jgi:hypothetical protein
MAWEYIYNGLDRPRGEVRFTWVLDNGVPMLAIQNSTKNYFLEEKPALRLLCFLFRVRSSSEEARSPNDSDLIAMLRRRDILVTNDAGDISVTTGRPFNLDRTHCVLPKEWERAYYGCGGTDRGENVWLPNGAACQALYNVDYMSRALAYLGLNDLVQQIVTDFLPSRLTRADVAFAFKHSPDVPRRILSDYRYVDRLEEKPPMIYRPPHEIVFDKWHYSERYQSPSKITGRERRLMQMAWALSAYQGNAVASTGCYLNADYVNILWRIADGFSFAKLLNFNYAEIELDVMDSLVLKNFCETGVKTLHYAEAHRPVWLSKGRYIVGALRESKRQCGEIGRGSQGRNREGKVTPLPDTRINASSVYPVQCELCEIVSARLEKYGIDLEYVLAADIVTKNEVNRPCCVELFGDIEDSMYEAGQVFPNVTGLAVYSIYLRVGRRELRNATRELDTCRRLIELVDADSTTPRSLPAACDANASDPRRLQASNNHTDLTKLTQGYVDSAKQSSLEQRREKRKVRLEHFGPGQRTARGKVSPTKYRYKKESKSPGLSMCILTVIQEIADILHTNVISAAHVRDGLIREVRRLWDPGG